MCILFPDMSNVLEQIWIKKKIKAKLTCKTHYIKHVLANTSALHHAVDSMWIISQEHDKLGMIDSRIL